MELHDVFSDATQLRFRHNHAVLAVIMQKSVGQDTVCIDEDRDPTNGHRLVEAKREIAQRLAELREALADSRRWREIGEVFRAHDAFYSSWIFFDSLLDRSVLGRAARHAWAQRQQAALLSQYHRPDGFAPKLAAVAQATLEAFTDSIRADRRMPVVLLFNNYGYRDHLYRVMKAVLDQKQIVYVSSHEFADASDRGSFLPDGHFLPEVDQAMASRLLKIVSGAPDGSHGRLQ